MNINMVKKYDNLLEFANVFYSIAAKLNISDQSVPSIENDSFTDLEPKATKQLKITNKPNIISYGDLVKKNVLEVSKRIGKLLKLLIERKKKLNIFESNELQAIVEDLDLFNKKIVQFAINILNSSNEEIVDVKDHSLYLFHLLQDNEELICGFGASQIRPTVNNLKVDITYLVSLLNNKILSPISDNDEDEDEDDEESYNNISAAE